MHYKRIKWGHLPVVTSKQPIRSNCLVGGFRWVMGWSEFIALLGGAADRTNSHSAHHHRPAVSKPRRRL